MIVALDTETEGVLWQHQAFCATTYSAEDGGLFWNLNDEGEYKSLQNYLARATTIVCHNLKFDLQKLLLCGILTEDDIQYPGRFEDTMVMSHLLNENRSRRLKDLAKEILGEETDEAEVLQKVRRELGLKVEDGYDKIPLDVLKPYALKDAEYTFKLYKVFTNQFGLHNELTHLYMREIKFILVLLKVEAEGLQVDLEYVKEQIKAYGSRIYSDKKKIEKITGLKIFEESDMVCRPLKEPRYTPKGNLAANQKETNKEAKERCLATTFNPNSPQQLISVFAGRGITLESTGVEEMRSLTDPLASAILELRENTKIRQTYFMGIMKEHHFGIVHPNFRPTGTKTGRLSSGTGE